MARRAPEELRAMIDDCIERQDTLTGGELNFLDIIDVAERFGLTEKQIAKLDDIWERVTA